VPLTIINDQDCHGLQQHGASRSPNTSVAGSLRASPEFTRRPPDEARRRTMGSVCMGRRIIEKGKKEREKGKFSHTKTTQFPYSFNELRAWIKLPNRHKKARNGASQSLWCLGSIDSSLQCTNHIPHSYCLLLSCCGSFSCILKLVFDD